MKKQRVLGKGLDALLLASNIDANVVSTLPSKDNADASLLKNISIKSIKPSSCQPRKSFNENDLNELAESIKMHGVIQPIILRIDGKNGYELVAGERRYKAAIIAGLEFVPAIVKDFTNKDALAISIIENIQRKDLTVIEEANSYRDLIEQYDLTHELVSKLTGKSRSHISNLLRLLNLSNKVQEMVILGQLTMGHARALLSLPESLQKIVADEIVNKNLTTNETEKRVNHLIALNNEENIDIEVSELNHYIVNYEVQIYQKLGLPTSIKHGQRGNGKITLKYSSIEEVENLIKTLYK